MRRLIVLVFSFLIFFSSFASLSAENTWKTAEKYGREEYPEISDDEIRNLRLAFMLMDLESLKLVRDIIDEAIKQKEPVIPDALKESLEVESGLRASPDLLYDEYNKNAVSADAKYKGVVFELEGYIKQIETESFGNRIYISISEKNDDNPFARTVRCYLSPSEAEKAIELSKGGHVVILGTGDGKPFVDITMKDCIIVSAD